MENSLPAIPAKRYFTIGEVSELCGVKPYVLRYWEQEFTQLKPMKRRGNRRYYQHHEVLLIRRIRDLLYDQGFTISGARNRLGDPQASAASDGGVEVIEMTDASLALHDLGDDADLAERERNPAPDRPARHSATVPMSTAQVREELISIRELLFV